jgi:high-affinity nickel-transport protein
MLGVLWQSLSRAAGSGRRLRLLFGGLLVANVAVWSAALYVLDGHSVLLGSAVLAYTLGLRHAVDADHIAAFVNSVRKLMQRGEKPIAAGLYFSLGHSLIVILMSAAVGFAASQVTSRFDQLKAYGAFVSTAASASFLLLLAAFNFVILVSVWRTFRAVQRGESFCEDDFDLLLNNRGMLSRLFRPLFRMVSKSWHLLPIGFLFGLGFDTATEVALFGLSATQAADGVSPWALLVYPALFTAGMTLIDTLDGALMLGAYGWAFLKPVRKLYYNLTISAVSVIVAVLIGGVETLGLIAKGLQLEGPFWDGVGAINGSFGLLGYAIIAIFLASWIVSAAIYRLRGYDALDVRA